MDRTATAVVLVAKEGSVRGSAINLKKTAKRSDAASKNKTYIT